MEEGHIIFAYVHQQELVAHSLGAKEDRNIFLSAKELSSVTFPKKTKDMNHWWTPAFSLTQSNVF